MKKQLAGSASLYIVGTPLGNLEDITYRAVEVLKSVPVIACEDTRHSRKLLQRYGITARLISCHEHNEETAARQVIALLGSGFPVALISDAGTPGISDPGYRVVRLALERGFKVVPVPGPSALTAALSASGLPTDCFFFAGFLPAREKALEDILRELAELRATLIFFCPARRIISALRKACHVLGDRQAALARELTKIHEEFLRGSLSEIAAELESRDKLKGEIVLMLAGKQSKSGEAGTDLKERLENLLEGVAGSKSMGARNLTLLAAERLGEHRNRVYPLVCAWLNKRKEDQNSQRN